MLGDREPQAGVQRALGQRAADEREEDALGAVGAQDFGLPAAQAGREHSGGEAGGEDGDQQDGDHRRTHFRLERSATMRTSIPGRRRSSLSTSGSENRPRPLRACGVPIST